MATGTPHRAKKTKKNRKHGRNAHFCLQYRNRNREVLNKVVRLKKHLVRFPNDVCAKAAMEAAKAAS
jgi:uncharacterized protein YbgA (DUF1722 family)